MKVRSALQRSLKYKGLKTDLFKEGGSLALLKLSQTFLLPLGLSLAGPLGQAGGG